MRAISSSELLEVWERGAAQPPAQRALLLLAVACGDQPVEHLARLPIGQRDGWLLRLRERLFGSRLTSLATCPACGARSELQFAVADIEPRSEAPPDEVHSATLADYEVTFRLPNSLDLLQLSPNADVAANRRLLLSECLLSTRHNGHPVSAAELPTEVAAAVAERMAQADPHADVQLALTCPQCARSWEAPLDIVGFLWAEIHAWARRLLGEVHALASAYGWCEADILALSPRRRQAYLELAGA